MRIPDDASLKDLEKKQADRELRVKSSKLSVKEGAVYSIMDGFGLRYITPYALALGLSNAYIGLLTSIPSILGNLSQLFTIRAMEKRSRKNLIVGAVILQTLMWLFLMGLGFIPFVLGIKSSATPVLLIALYTMLVVFGSFVGPAWTSLMRDTVVEGVGTYFGRRNRIAGLVSLVCMLIAGFLLDYFKQTKLFIGFIVLFTIAFLARAVSALLLSRMYDPGIKFEKGYYFSFWGFIRHMFENNFGRFVLFMALVSLATAIASPFFAVYMLKNLGFSYVSYIIVSIASSLAALFFMPFWGKFADAYGNRVVMQICGLLVGFVPLLWLATLLIPTGGMLVYLCVIEVFSGFAWAGFNLASSNYVFSAVTRQRMGLCVSYMNILSSIGVFIGATAGGLLSSLDATIFGLSAILFVFLLSGVARLSAYFAMIHKIKEVETVCEFGMKEVKKKLTTLSPQQLLNYFDLRRL